MHDIRYDEVHDEFFVVNPFAEAVLAFRAESSGQEAPIRIIQGPHVKIGGTRLAVDPVHNEIFVPDSGRIRVYPRDANGDMAPIRGIEGPDTQLSRAASVAVRPVNNILVVGLNKAGDEPDGAILMLIAPTAATSNREPSFAGRNPRLFGSIKWRYIRRKN